jgi:hypothetical protein
MPNTQFTTVTLNPDGSIEATGPYHTDIANDPQWQLVGKPIVIFMVVKSDSADDPDLVANGVGELDMNGGTPGDTWTGIAAANSATAQMKVGDDVRAIGAAIQVKTNKQDKQNPPVVEMITWCVRQTLV